MQLGICEWRRWPLSRVASAMAGAGINLRLMLAAVLGLATGFAAAGASAASADDAIITNVHVISMVAPGVAMSQDVTVRDGRIAAIEPAKALDVEDGAAAGGLAIDGNGGFLIPGLAEMHAHVPVEKDYRDDVLFLWAANGVTTVRGMLGHPSHLPLRDDLLAQRVLGPRLITSGPSFNGRSVRNAADAERRVREQHAAGYDFLKVHPGLSPESFEAMAATAQEAGISFGGHVTASVGLWCSLAAGQTTVDHLDGYLNVITPDSAAHGDAAASFFSAGLAPFVDRALIPAAVERSRAAAVAVVPTETLMENMANAHAWQEMAERPEFQYVPRRLRERYIETLRRAANGAKQRANQAFLEVRKALIKALHEGGVPVLLGADSPQTFNVPGFATHRELRAMVAAGLSSNDALAAGTSAAAAFLGTNAGVIAVGRDADLALLAANPLDDIANAARIEGVMLRGRWLSREAIEAGLKRIAAKHH